jgi:flagellar basal-body rod protein FlgF
MDRLIHTAYSGLRSAMMRQTATANNVANTSTPGFRGEMMAAQSRWIGNGGMVSRTFTSDGVVGADMRAGAVQTTGRALDIALQADALLGVRADDGSEAYTRRGDLSVGEDGRLLTGDGSALLGDAGPIIIPSNDSMRITDDGTIFIVPRGGDHDAPQRIDRLRLVSPMGGRVIKGTDGLFRAAPGTALAVDPDARLTAGALEASNVDPTSALVAMIEASRGWDNQMQMLTTARDLDSASTELMRLPS